MSSIMCYEVLESERLSLMYYLIDCWRTRSENDPPRLVTLSSIMLAIARDPILVRCGAQWALTSTKRPPGLGPFSSKHLSKMLKLALYTPRKRKGLGPGGLAASSILLYLARSPRAIAASYDF